MKLKCEPKNRLVLIEFKFEFSSISMIFKSNESENALFPMNFKLDGREMQEIFEAMKAALSIIDSSELGEN